MQALNIPKEWLELNERNAAKIAGVSRTTLRTKHLVDGCPEPISRKTRPDNSTYIPFDEIHRIYGEQALSNLNDLIKEKEKTSTSNETTVQKPNHTNEIDQEKPENQLKNQTITMSSETYLNLKLRLDALEKELEHKNELFGQLQNSLTDEKQRSEKYFSDLQTHMKLLEDKSAKERDYKADMDAAIASLQAQVQQKPNFWQRLFGLTPSNKNAPAAPQSTEDAIKSSKG